ncbi:DciA family protein [Histophilus somni]|uniref:DciA family protein n=1 Tax=Histophilus somni TaxID=731 RepID=UPI00201E7F81|nr:DciA family protein [Histophilus somni]
MRYSKPINFNELLELSPLMKMIHKASLLDELNEQIQHLFPIEFKGFYRVINFESDTVWIEVVNATVRQAFLFQQSPLLQLIQRQYPSVNKLAFKINPDLKPV